VTGKSERVSFANGEGDADVYWPALNIQPSVRQGKITLRSHHCPNYHMLVVLSVIAAHVHQILQVESDCVQLRMLLRMLDRLEFEFIFVIGILWRSHIYRSKCTYLWVVVVVDFLTLKSRSKPILSIFILSFVFVHQCLRRFLADPGSEEDLNGIQLSVPMLIYLPISSNGHPFPYLPFFFFFKTKLFESGHVDVAYDLLQSPCLSWCWTPYAKHSPWRY
jgi:hypothetical protein